MIGVISSLFCLNNQQKGVTMWVISHHYSINLDNCCYYRASKGGGSKFGEFEGGTVFKMNNGRIIIITCDYKTVRDHISNRRNELNHHQINEVVLQY